MAYNASLAEALRPAEAQIGTLDATTEPTATAMAGLWAAAASEVEMVLALAGLAVSQTEGTTAHTVAKQIEALITSRSALLSKSTARRNLQPVVDVFNDQIDRLCARLRESAEELIQASQATPLRTDADGTYGRAWSSLVDWRSPDDSALDPGFALPYIASEPDFPADGEF